MESQALENRFAVLEDRIDRELPNHETRIEKIERILNGNGRLGLVSQVRILWNIHNKVGLMFAAVTGSLVTALINWFFS